jgi:hypothetical protein
MCRGGTDQGVMDQAAAEPSIRNGGQHPVERARGQGQRLSGKHAAPDLHGDIRGYGKAVREPGQHDRE